MLQIEFFFCFFNIWFITHQFFLQARNSYSNEVVAIKKMSYNGKQTTEVRLPHTEQHTHANLCTEDKECIVKKNNHNITEACQMIHASVRGVKCFETLWLLPQNKEAQ